MDNSMLHQHLPKDYIRLKDESDNPCYSSTAWFNLWELDIITQFSYKIEISCDSTLVSESIIVYALFHRTLTCTFLKSSFARCNAARSSEREKSNLWSHQKEAVLVEAYIHVILCSYPHKSIHIDIQIVGCVLTNEVILSVQLHQILRAHECSRSSSCMIFLLSIFVCSSFQ